MGTLLPYYTCLSESVKVQSDAKHTRRVRIFPRLLRFLNIYFIIFKLILINKMSDKSKLFRKTTGKA